MMHKNIWLSSLNFMLLNMTELIVESRCEIDPIDENEYFVENTILYNKTLNKEN